MVSQHKSQGGSGAGEGICTPTIAHAYILPTCVNKYFLEGVVHFMRVRSFARHGLRVIWPICQYKSLGSSACRTSPSFSINFHNRWLNKATHTNTLTRAVSLTSHGSDLGGESQPVYDAHTFRFMSISLFCRQVLSGVSLALFELCFTYFYSLNTFSPGDAAGPNQIMAYLDLAEVKTQIAINM